MARRATFDRIPVPFQVLTARYTGQRTYFFQSRVSKQARGLWSFLLKSGFIFGKRSAVAITEFEKDILLRGNMKWRKNNCAFIAQRVSDASGRNFSGSG